MTALRLAYLDFTRVERDALLRPPTRAAQSLPSFMRWRSTTTPKPRWKWFARRAQRRSRRRAPSIPPIPKATPTAQAASAPPVGDVSS